MFTIQVIYEINCCHDSFLSGLIFVRFIFICTYYITYITLCHYTGNIIFVLRTADLVTHSSHIFLHNMEIGNHV